jgi:hypothetical protein
MIIYLGPRLPEGSCDLPGSLGRAVLTPITGDASLCGLAPGGVFQALPVARKPGGLLPHRFTLAPLSGRSSFLWHCPWGRPLSRFGTALPCGARTFLPPFPGGDHLTRSESKNNDKFKIGNLRLHKYPLQSLQFEIPNLQFAIFSSIALFASASASLFCSRGMYVTSTLPIFAINSLAFSYSGLRPSFFTLY